MLPTGQDSTSGNNNPRTLKPSRRTFLFFGIAALLIGSIPVALNINAASSVTIAEHITQTMDDNDAMKLPSWYPQTGETVIVAVAAREDKATISIDGNGLRWEEVSTTKHIQDNGQLVVFSAYADRQPTPGQITISFDDETTAVASATRLLNAQDISHIESIPGTDPDSNDVTTEMPYISEQGSVVLAYAWHRTKSLDNPPGTNEIELSLNRKTGDGGDTTQLSSWYEKVTTPGTVTIGSDNNLSRSHDWILTAFSVLPITGPDPTVNPTPLPTTYNGPTPTTILNPCTTPHPTDTLTPTPTLRINPSSTPRPTNVTISPTPRPSGTSLSPTPTLAPTGPQVSLYPTPVPSGPQVSLYPTPVPTGGLSVGAVTSTSTPEEGATSLSLDAFSNINSTDRILLAVAVRDENVVVSVDEASGIWDEITDIDHVQNNGGLTLFTASFPQSGEAINITLSEETQAVATATIIHNLHQFGNYYESEGTDPDSNDVQQTVATEPSDLIVSAAWHRTQTISNPPGQNDVPLLLNAEAGSGGDKTRLSVWYQISQGGMITTGSENNLSNDHDWVLFSQVMR